MLLLFILLISTVFPSVKQVKDVDETRGSNGFMKTGYRTHERMFQATARSTINVYVSGRDSVV